MSAPMNSHVTNFRKEAEATGRQVEKNLLNGDPNVAALDLKELKIYTTQPLIFYSLLDEQLPPPSLLNLDDPNQNVITIAMMVFEQFGLVVAFISIDSRREVRNKLIEELNFNLKGIRLKLAKDLEIARTQYKMGAVNVRTAKLTMRMAIVQFYLSNGAAIAKGIGGALSSVLPGAGATANIAGGILENSAAFIGHGITAVQTLNQAQQSYLQADVTRLTGEASAIERFYQAAANFSAGERSLLETMGRALQDIYQNVNSTLSQLAPQQYLHLIV
jgi:hypothetical protein